MLIGILQTGDVPPELLAKSGDYPDMFQRLLGTDGFTFRTYRVLDLDFPQSARDCDGWLITGSRHGVYEDHAFIPPLEALIREIYAARVPLIGVCFGHQIIAQALGGKVEKFEGGWNVGAHDYQIGGETLRLNAWHQDQVVEKPADAVCLGGNDSCANAVLLYGDRALSIQPHPEFDRTTVEVLMDHRGAGIVPDDRLAQAQARKDLTLDRAKFAKTMIEFFRQPRS